MIGPEKLRLRRAIRASKEAEARLVGMKIRARLDPPRAATGGFPYPARTCAEWEVIKGVAVDREMTDEERQTDAERGSAMLLDAMLRLAA